MADEADTPSVRPNPTTWKRWVDNQDNLHLHNICSFVPQVQRCKGFPYLRFRPEDQLAATPADSMVPTFTDPRTDTQRRFVFIGGFTRQVLRHTPLVILVAVVVLFGSAELTDTVGGLSDLMPTVDESIWLVGVWAAPVPFLAYLLYRAKIIGGGQKSLTTLITVYGLPLALLGGVLASLVLIFTADTPSELEPNVIYVSGYLLTLLIGGQLFYDTIIRTENLLVNLPDTQIVSHEMEYYRLLGEMQDSLSTRILGIRASVLFGLLFAIQFGALWTLADGPQQLGYEVNIAINTVLNVVLVIATFQFIIIIRYANELFSDDGRYDYVLGYEPFHVDTHGGYRDFGRFAIRFNLLIGLGALYLVYRLYASGSRGVPPEGLAGFTEQFDLLIWLINYVGPVLIFAVVLIAWAYLAFWGMHKKMVREKDRLTYQYQGTPESSGTAGAGVPSSEIIGGPAWEDIKEAPEWPVNPARLKGIVTGTFLPLLFPLPGLLF